MANRVQQHTSEQDLDDKKDINLQEFLNTIVDCFKMSSLHGNLVGVKKVVGCSDKGVLLEYNTDGPDAQNTMERKIRYKMKTMSDVDFATAFQEWMKLQSQGESHEVQAKKALLQCLSRSQRSLDDSAIETLIRRWFSVGQCNRFSLLIDRLLSHLLTAKIKLRYKGQIVHSSHVRRLRNNRVDAFRIMYTDKKGQRRSGTDVLHTVLLLGIGDKDFLVDVTAPQIKASHQQVIIDEVQEPILRHLTHNSDPEPEVKDMFEQSVSQDLVTLWSWAQVTDNRNLNVLLTTRLLKARECRRQAQKWMQASVIPLDKLEKMKKQFNLI